MRPPRTLLLSLPIRGAKTEPTAGFIKQIMTGLGSCQCVRGSATVLEQLESDVEASDRDIINIRRSGQRGEFVLDCQMLLEFPREQVFPFFADAINLEQITPPLLRFRILTPHPIKMQVGALIDYRLRLRGLPMKWKTEITAWEPPYRFVDEQLKGPYRKWVHEHTFERVQLSSGREGTLVRDVVHYSMFGGALINRLLIARDLREIFGFRQAEIRKHFAVRRPGGGSVSSA